MPAIDRSPSTFYSLTDDVDACVTFWCQTFLTIPWTKISKIHSLLSELGLFKIQITVKYGDTCSVSKSNRQFGINSRKRSCSSSFKVLSHRTRQGTAPCRIRCDSTFRLEDRNQIAALIQKTRKQELWKCHT